MSLNSRSKPESTMRTGSQVGAINAIIGDMPKECDEPIIQKMDSTSAPVISVSVKSQTLGPKELTTLVEKGQKKT